MSVRGVVHVRDIIRPYEPLPEGYTYIGRQANRWGLAASKWANPYWLTRYSREDSLKLYRPYVLAWPHLRAQLLELEEEILVCWCRPEPCHGDVLAELVELALHGRLPSWEESHR